MKKIRILLVDDYDLVRAGLRALLVRVADFEVVGEAGDGREVLTKIKLLSPDVVLMDIMRPELNGLDAMVKAIASFPRLRILILSIPIRVLILEDNAGDAELMAWELRRAGFDPTWQRIREVLDGD